MGAATLTFVALSFGISTTFGIIAFAIGGSETFENPRALPALLVTIWSPNIAAVIVTEAWGESTGDLVAPLLDGAPILVWAGALVPLVIAAIVGVGRSAATPFGPRLALTLLAVNVMMGPLGEELGWRGFLLPRLSDDVGLIGAGAVIGVVWALWHAPLWWLPSPHREIPFSVFFATVVCFSMTMTAIWEAGDGALGPIVVFHLGANVGVAWLELTERADAATAYRRALPFHLGAAILATLWLAS